MTPPTFRRLPLVSALALALAAAAAPAQTPADPATERAALQELRSTTLALIDLLVEQGLLSRAKADELLSKARPAAAVPAWGAPPAKTPKVVRVPYLPETARAQMKEEIKNEILGTARDEGWTDGRRLPGWLKNVAIDGDLRVRGQAELFDSANIGAESFTVQSLLQDSPAWAPDLTNTQYNRGRLTARARLGATVKASDSVTAQVRVATGSTTGSPSSESVTLGNYGNRWSIGIDRGWIKWEPRQGWSLQAGRMGVPFDHSDLIWPADLGLDGVAGKGEIDLASGLYGFAVAGAFPLEEFANNRNDKWLYGGQIGLDWAPNGQWQLRGSIGLYDFQNVEGTVASSLPPVNQRAGTTPYLQSQYPAAVRQKGNTLINLNHPTCITTPSTPGCASSATWGLASRFRPVDLRLGVVARHFRPYELSLDLDVVKNTGFDTADISRRAGEDLSALKAKTLGYQVRLGLGMPRLREPGDWQAHLAWRHFERDAWIDAFTDTAWHGGGTNYRGFSLGGEYAFDHQTTLGLRFISTRNLDDKVRYTDSSGQVSGNMSSATLRIDTLQIETNVRF
ncbi:putative porin [Ideonella sp. 4Y16]|uniref:putative porin n=1 Tax=Ideonella alba TaxID=2824118 RepID=UPI001B398108|nr:putative porin [Ideonella alba]MBQ0942884.1 putative porin [Ideonella alba]